MRPPRPSACGKRARRIGFSIPSAHRADAPAGAPVEFLKQIQLATLFLERSVVAPDVFNELLDPRMLGIDVRSLEDAGKKSILPVVRVFHRITARAHYDEARQILVGRPEPVGDPGPEARPTLHGVPAIHEHQRGFMVGELGFHRTDHRNVIDATAQVRKKVAHLNAALAVFLEFERRRKGRPGFAFGLDVFARQRLARYFASNGLGSNGSTWEGPPLRKK